MSLWCLPSSFSSIWLTVWEMSFEEFQVGCHGGHLGYRNRTMLAILNLYSFRCLPLSFCSIWLMIWEMSFEDFQHGHHGSHLGYQNGTILAIMHLCVPLTPPIKFWLNPSYGLRDVIWRISRWPPWRPSWISERNDFSISESPCCHNASH